MTLLSMYRASALVLVFLTLVTKAVSADVISEGYDLHQRVLRDFTPNDSKEEYIRHIHSMINAYRSDMLGGRLVIETNSMVDTKYKTWKRNADLINSLLALPKGMNEAGR